MANFELSVDKDIRSTFNGLVSEMRDTIRRRVESAAQDITREEIGKLQGRLMFRLDSSFDLADRQFMVTLEVKGVKEDNGIPTQTQA